MKDKIAYKKFDDIGILVFVNLLLISLFLILEFKTLESLTPLGFYYVVSIPIVSFISYTIIKIFAPFVDKVILPIIIFISYFGIAMIYRIEIKNVKLNYWNANSFRESLFLIAGLFIGLLIIIFLKDYRSLKKYSWISMIVGIVFIFLPMIPDLKALPIHGVEMNGAKLWVSVWGMNFQPAEFAKLLLAIFFSAYLYEQRDRLAIAGPKVFGIQLPRLIDLAPILVVCGICLLVLVGQRDLGTSLLFMGLFVSLLYVTTNKKSWIFIGFILFGIGAFIAYNMFSHLRARVEMWQDPFSGEIYNRIGGGSFQLVQGLFSLANGGLFGTGIGNGYPSMTPFSESDFIYSAIGEEFGLTGLMALLLLYMILCIRIVKSAISINDGFGKLLASGIGFLISLQVFVVVGGITRVIPLTGLTLPYIARGGSSLIANIIMISIVIVISNKSRIPYTDDISESIPSSTRNPRLIEETKSQNAVSLPTTVSEVGLGPNIGASVGTGVGEPSDDFIRISDRREQLKGAKSE
jgi:cell division protein FtsW (lipid II flippase)